MTPKNVCIPRELQLQAAMFRLGNVDEEIHAGYEILQKYHKTVTFFGSARISEDSEYYQKAKDLAFQWQRNHGSSQPRRHRSWWTINWL